jgi:hypothetical protein
LLGVELHGHLQGVSETEAQALMRAAHDVCPTPTRRGGISRCGSWPRVIQWRCLPAP